MRSVRCLCPAAVLLSCVAFARPAAATVSCETLPSPVYGVGGSSLTPLLGAIAGELAAAGTTVVYQSPGNCFGIDDLSAGTALTGTASYWDTTATQQTCSLSIAGEVPVFGAMNTYVTACPGETALPSDTGDFLSAIQAFAFVVPKASSQQVISGPAAYFVYGFGTGGEVSPWTDESFIFKRDVNAAVSILMGLAVNVPASKMVGVDGKNNATMVADVANSTSPEATIGMLAGEVADANRSTLNVLAYQHYGQSCGYLPDSTSTAFDKQNIRDGQYVMWGKIHLLAKIDGSGTIVDPGAATLINAYLGNAPLPSGKDIRALEASVGAIPDCAMEVSRTTDMGPYSSYAPAEPCGCLFESIATGSTTCTACTDNTGCTASAPNCRYGFCEVN